MTGYVRENIRANITMQNSQAEMEDCIIALQKYVKFLVEVWSTETLAMRLFSNFI